jgi:hypothetical protein
MRKIFFISFVFLLLNNFANAKELKIECTVKKTDEKGNFYKEGDKTIWTYDLSSKKYLITDDFIRHYNLAKIEDKFFLQYVKIFRYTGEFIQKSAEIPEDQLKDLLNVDYKNQNSETYDKVFFLVNDFFLKNKASKDNVYWQEYIMDCIKAKKRF